MPWLIALAYRHDERIIAIFTRFYYRILKAILKLLCPTANK